MKKILFLITITFLTSINSFGQINDFEYNEELYLEYAITGIKEYYYVSKIKEKFQEQFDIKNYFTASKIISDCNQNPTKIILYSFKNYESNSNASIYIVISDDNLFDSFLIRGHSIISPEEELKQFIKKENKDELFKCGL